MYGNAITEITPQQGVTNETLVGDFSSYFRYLEDTREHQIDWRIDPCISESVWVTCPTIVHTQLTDQTNKITVGQLIYRLAESVRQNQEQQRKHDTFAEQAYDAIRIIGDRLIEESEARGWCNEFDRIIDEVNESLPGTFELPTRIREYQVDWTEYVTVQISCSITVRASDESDAISIARDEFDGVHTSDIVDAVRYGNWEVDEYADHDFCVGEV